MPRTRLAIGALVLTISLMASACAVNAKPSGPIAAPAPAASGTGWLHTNGGRIVDASGNTVRLIGVNWFGAEVNGTCAPHGLWTRSLDSMVAQMASLGFNTIRLPFANECIAPGKMPGSIDFAKNPDLVGKTTVQVLDAVVASAGAHGMRVILDRHRPDANSQSELWYTAAWPESRWISDWQMLAARYKNNPTVIGADLHNEPHGQACWGCGVWARDWAAASERAGNAILAVNPNWLILVEGIEAQGNNQWTWWGGGLADVAHRPIHLSVANRVVYSPHDYPASVYQQKWFTAPNYPGNLAGVWDANWGYIAKQGIAPILVGEFGTNFTTGSDQAWLRSLAAYMAANGMSGTYWSWNPNSGDTGGILKDDWQAIQAAKLQALGPLLGTAVVGPTPPTTKPPATTPPTTTPPVTTPPTTSPPAPAGPGTTSYAKSGNLEVRLHVAETWPGGFIIRIGVNTTTGTRSGWVVSFPGTWQITNSWGMSCVSSSGTTTCTGKDWAANVNSTPIEAGIQMNGVPPSTAPITIH